MLPEERQQYIDRIQKVLEVAHVVPVATVSPGSVPHNSPVFMAFDRDFNAIWASRPSTQHSQNIARTGEVFLSVFDSRCEFGGGLYIDATASVLDPDDPDFTAAFAIYSQAKQAFGGAASSREDYAQPDGQRLYCAVPKQLWLNYSEKDKRGVVQRDKRFRVSVAALRGDAIEGA